MTSTTNAISLSVAKKVLLTVDAGLVSGLGKPVPGEMCVEAAVCYAMGLPHSDDPSCVSRAIRALKIALNDAQWSSKESRAKGMRRLALVQLGSAGVVDDKVFAVKVAELSIRKNVPIALRAVASLQKDEHHRQALLDAALLCEREGTESAAESAEDKTLSDFAEGVVQILIEMKAPGCKWLYLTEK